MKQFTYKGRIITASTKVEAIKQIVASPIKYDEETFEKALEILDDRGHSYSVVNNLDRYASDWESFIKKRNPTAKDIADGIEKWLDQLTDDQLEELDLL